MPVCDECGDDIFNIEEHMDDSPSVERLYRAVADGEPKLEVMHLIYSMFGDACGLRHPAAELRLSSLCATAGGLKHG
ncbi:hypothetical protein LAV84_06780 [Rhizobium sp. VS19-DR104.2]|uniref:hypothetical protein n=1 Tax=unclassified Rhizobium TaxID=2613769 RepID=UPI001CC4E794|nr:MULTISPECIES: hypothetical protein [unclassified Rhizobium]MBZ5760251.1 hypothetical protein [Rhizobium sp. VS19-DR96]MBZ5766905.1 hypothetical protein [Rhizobium sp. VS19-DR129.2]MBZ5773102.1 hypothetical protein [Rhizobium sp. VS19-DRK62.2]MBZ5784086.1 hypothetical protein [Rhizobium sp. VS19-DR121]MBZ5802446.1 hypothetical protein [Rhizobium sp. VS19-DR181]